MTPLVSSTLLRAQSDARLVKLAAAGSDRAFEVIVERYRPPLLRSSRRVLPESRAEDAVQQAFLNAWSALREGTEVEDLRSWLYRIARNAALDQLKLRGYDYDELSDSLRVGGRSEEELERRRVMRETLAGVAALPGNQRQALLRTVVEGASRAEVARELDVSEGAVRQLLHRARAALRAAASAITPAPLVSWAAVGSAGTGGTLVKAGTVVMAAGVLATGPGNDLRQDVAPESSRAADSQPAATPSAAPDEARAAQAISSGFAARDGDETGRARSGSSDGDDDDDDRSGPGDGDDELSSSNSGPGSLSSGPGGGLDTSGSSGSGSSGSDSSGSGSSGTSALDSSGSGSSGSGTSGSGSSGSGSSGSGSGSDGD